MSNIRLPILHSARDLPSQPSEGAVEISKDAGVTSAEAQLRPKADAWPTPEEALMQVGDLAREAGKTVRAIHLYEQLELLKPAGRSKGRYRLYGPEALVRIRWIGKLQELGFSLTDIKSIMRDFEKQGSAPSAMVTVRDVYMKKL